MECGVTIKTGVQVSSVDVERTIIEFEDGTEVQPDLIIAADGLHVSDHAAQEQCNLVSQRKQELIETKKSVIRPHIVDASANYPEVTNGQGCLRFTLPMSSALKDPVASRAISDDFRMFMFNGPNKQIIVYAVDDAKLLNFNCTHPVALSAQQTHAEDAESGKS